MSGRREEVACSSVEEVVEGGRGIGYPILLRGRGGRDAGRVIDDWRSAASEEEARSIAKFMFAQHKLLLPVRKKRLEMMMKRQAQKKLSEYELHEVRDEIKSLSLAIESLKIFVSSSSMKAKAIREYRGSSLWDPNLCQSYMPCDNATLLLRAAYTADSESISNFPVAVELWQDHLERQEQPRKLAPLIERVEYDLMELRGVESKEEIQQLKIARLESELETLKREQEVLEADSALSVREIEDMKQKQFKFPRQDVEEDLDIDRKLQEIEDDQTLSQGRKRVAKAKLLQEKSDHEDKQRHPASRQTSSLINEWNNQYLRWMPVQLSASTGDASSFSRLLDLGAYIATDELLRKKQLKEENIGKLCRENQISESRIRSLQSDIAAVQEQIDKNERSIASPNLSPAEFSQLQSELRIGRERLLSLQRDLASIQESVEEKANEAIISPCLLFMLLVSMVTRG
ncbi:hypothetical protein GUITHDRAFT_143060 [Guillardia theta CCMP2712]|uniref:Uncharacterized protein n=1 Tax=Guillardia theta (strain CCMP2712) TaxID=905079 RepID=L1IV34_GUITC|nr:hypothetical protein GUITHDRAFT_143060 [Guillardia theta CCMP2712]EKX40121.1 hypothetical protein GUITHDRAFT_143060 [Guillardia theta CCMP2712]|eukprot:XP_005827101.1 hypothetical protein GUITHDRAFT_143060 [Guillardia theta CCMP2712]